MAKILILGEYSGFAKNLKRGFLELGHHATIISCGDGVKSISVEDNDDLLLTRKNISINGKTIRGSWRISFPKQSIVLRKWVRRHIQTFDYAFVINSNFIGSVFFNGILTLKQLQSVLKDRGNIYLSSCGIDYPFLKYSNLLCPKPHDDKYNALLASKYHLRNDYQERNFIKIYKHIKGMIPAYYDAAVCCREFGKNYGLKIFDTVPLPIHIDKNNKPAIIDNQKLTIFYGINRPEEKGGKYLIEAMETLQKKHSDKVEIIITEMLPFEQYQKIIAKVDIIMDQCMGYSYGMNAIISMSKGKVVFSCNEPQLLKEFKLDYIPVINITSNIQQAVESLEKFIGNRDYLDQVKADGTDYVNRVHEARLVASRLLTIFNEN